MGNFNEYIFSPQSFEEKKGGLTLEDYKRDIGNLLAAQFSPTKNSKYLNDLNTTIEALQEREQVLYSQFGTNNYQEFRAKVRETFLKGENQDLLKLFQHLSVQGLLSSSNYEAGKQVGQQLRIKNAIQRNKNTKQGSQVAAAKEAQQSTLNNLYSQFYMGTIHSVGSNEIYDLLFSKEDNNISLKDIRIVISGGGSNKRAIQINNLNDLPFSVINYVHGEVEKYVKNELIESKKQPDAKELEKYKKTFFNRIKKALEEVEKKLNTEDTIKNKLIEEGFLDTLYSYDVVLEEVKKKASTLKNFDGIIKIEFKFKLVLFPGLKKERNLKNLNLGLTDINAFKMLVDERTLSVPANQNTDLFDPEDIDSIMSFLKIEDIVGKNSNIYNLVKEVISYKTKGSGSRALFGNTGPIKLSGDIGEMLGVVLFRVLLQGDDLNSAFQKSKDMVIPVGAERFEEGIRASKELPVDIMLRVMDANKQETGIGIQSKAGFTSSIFIGDSHNIAFINNKQLFNDRNTGIFQDEFGSIEDDEAKNVLKEALYSVLGTDMAYRAEDQKFEGTDNLLSLIAQSMSYFTALIMDIGIAKDVNDLTQNVFLFYMSQYIIPCSEILQGIYDKLEIFNNKPVPIVIQPDLHNGFKEEDVNLINKSILGYEIKTDEGNLLSKIKFSVEYSINNNLIKDLTNGYDILP